MDVFSAFNLSGRTAAVTGAGSGIGRATAETLAAAGANVVAADVDTAGAEQTVAAITEAGGKALPRHADVTQKADVDALAELAVSEFGRLDIMCNVAGIASDGLLLDATEKDFDTVTAVNLKGVFFGCQAALRAMMPQGSGSIVNVSSSAIDAPGWCTGQIGRANGAQTFAW